MNAGTSVGKLRVKSAGLKVVRDDDIEDLKRGQQRRHRDDERTMSSERSTHQRDEHHVPGSSRVRINLQHVVFEFERLDLDIGDRETAHRLERSAKRA